MPDVRLSGRALSRRSSKSEGGALGESKEKPYSSIANGEILREDFVLVLVLSEAVLVLVLDKGVTLKKSPPWPASTTTTP